MAAMGRVHEVLLRVRISSCTEKHRLLFAFNGTELADSSRRHPDSSRPNSWRRVNQMYTMSSPRYRVFGQWFVFRLEPELWPEVGENTIEVTLLELDPAVPPNIALRDVDADIKYLRGKSFHRGFVDDDLGPYETNG